MSNETPPKVEYEYDAPRLAQALLSFAGVLKDSPDPVARAAAQQLRQNVKQARVKV